MSGTSIGSSGVTFPDSSVQNTQATGFGFKNRIINGAMVIDQRNAGASGTATGYTIDRWAYGATQASKGTWGQNYNSVSFPSGFSNYLGFQTASSSYSVGSSDYFYFYQPIEGFNIADLSWGTANAKTITLSFWVYSSLTGTFGGSLRNTGAALSYPFSYTISAANTWTQISVTIAGPTTGTWLSNNGAGIYVGFGFGVGSTLSASAGSWQSGNYISATGATSVVGTANATFYITGVQLEKGSTATSFDYRPYGTELALCQRYYFAAGGSVANRTGCVTQTTTTAAFNYSFPVTMRAAPSLGYTAVGNFSAYTFYNSTAHTATALAFNGVTTNSAWLTVTYATSATAGSTASLDISNSDQPTFNSEL